MTADIRVCFLGDSFTLGQGDDDGLGWVGRVHAAERGRGIDLTSYKLGIRGQTGAEVAARAAREVGERLAGKGERRCVVIACGTNDIFYDRPVEETVTALEGIARWALGQGWAVFVTGCPHAAGLARICPAVGNRDECLDGAGESVRRDLR